MLILHFKLNMIVPNYNYRYKLKSSLVFRRKSWTMIVFFVFGIFLASARGLDTLGPSPAMVDSNIQYVKIPPLSLPAEEKVPNAHDQDCPQNELLVQILNILTDQKSMNYFDEPTKTYVLNLLKGVLQDSPQHEKISNDILRNNPANNLLRGLANADNKIKITVQYELPASNNCEKSLENLYKIINVLNEARAPTVSKFEIRTETPEVDSLIVSRTELYTMPNHDRKVQNKHNEEALKALFESPNTNVKDLLENYRPRLSAQMQQDVLLDKRSDIPQNPSNNLVRINYDFNRASEYRPNDFQIQNPVVVPKTDNNLDPVEEKVLWKNPDFDQNPHDNPNDVYNNLLRALMAIAQKPQHQSSTEEDKVNDSLPKSRIVQDPYVYSSANEQYLSPVDNQTPTNNYDQVVVPVPTGNDNIYESYAQNGKAQYKIDPYSGKLQNQPGVNFVDMKQKANHDKIVEITYVLQQPKKVHYEPVYLIKYRLPLKVFEEHVYKLILSKPFLKQDPNKLYQELLASLKLDNRFTKVTELRSKEINNINNDMEKDNHELTSKVKEIEDELKIIKELNANVSSSDLLLINNGTVENELKRLKRHPVLLNENII